MSFIEYSLTHVISLLHEIYVHSEYNYKYLIPLFTNSKYHKKHHHIGGGNYGIYFSIWDDYMNTKIRTRLKRRKIKKV
jgi:sterol desaturase/sphingolipid hydroxylase (fatty acid hydroxylase superfamily)